MVRKDEWGWWPERVIFRGMTVVNALLRRHFFDTFLPVWFEVVHLRSEVPAEGVGRVDVCRPRLKDPLL